MENEQRLIEYDAVYKYAFDGVHCGNLEDEDFSAIINAIDAVPTVDAVEVVRCNDCKWFNKSGYDNSHEDDLTLHMGYCYEWRRGTQACRFCSYGERRYGE